MEIASIHTKSSTKAKFACIKYLFGLEFVSIINVKACYFNVYASQTVSVDFFFTYELSTNDFHSI